MVIEAHADEISWFVNYIDDNGYIFVRRNGGSDAVIAPSMRCNLHTKKGVVSGIFGYPAIHVRDTAKDKAPTVNDIFIDLGAANKKEVEDMGVHVGTVVTFVDGLMELNDKYFVGRALDNRMGGFMIAEVARMLKENGVTLPFTLYVVNAVQEEIGLRGAEMIVKRLKPDLAIITVYAGTECNDPIYLSLVDQQSIFSGHFLCGLECLWLFLLGPVCNNAWVPVLL